MENNDVKYLYGAAVQGIQGFIFQTNELKDIVGASELVENICTKMFNEYVSQDDELVLHAAGNIKCIFSTRKRCEKAVREFPMKVLEAAPGITISQAVVEYNDNFSECIEKLEQKLRLQRNKPTRSITTGMVGIKRSRHTGLPATFINEDDFIDESTFVKLFYETEKRKATTSELCMKAFGFPVKHERIAYDTKELTQANDWIAVIHADGNGLGQVVQKVGKIKKDFKEFSDILNEATVEAAGDAFSHIISKYGLNDKFPVRPIVLGGDDLTVICRGDIAIDYVTEFMKQFEKHTEKLSDILKRNDVFEGGANHLTACAGVAFIKSSFPFYYGYELAESLCEEAKKDAKNKEFVEKNGGLAPSCLMFHKVQDSFVEDYKAIVKRELTPNDGHSWKFGPYYTDKEIAKEIGRWSVDDDLNVMVEQLKGNPIKSHLRQWMSLMINDENVAMQKIKRVISMAPESKALVKKLTDPQIRDVKEKNGVKSVKTYPVYDVLALYSIKNQITNNEEDD